MIIPKTLAVLAVMLLVAFVLSRLSKKEVPGMEEVPRGTRIDNGA